MKTINIVLLGLLVVILCSGACACAFLAGTHYERQKMNFHDAEGNYIPVIAVQALVKDQFVQVDSAECSLINAYFYAKQ